MEDLIKWKRDFEIFFIDHYAGDIGNTSIAGTQKQILPSVPPTL